MRIGSNIPFHIAKAYGFQPASKPAAIAPTARLEPASPTNGADSASITPGLRQLLAGTVRVPVDFASASTPARPAGPVLQLYTRSADTVEAATGIQLGRSLDLKG